MKKILYVWLFATMFTACSQNAFEDVLFRTTEDPFNDAPSVDSLTCEHTIYLKWKEDEACDRFRLMRSHDQTTLNFSCIYEGTSTDYTDTDLYDGNRYIYRLDKIRGKKYFEGKSYGYGFSSDCRKDIYEENDRESSATLLEYDRICNLPCVCFLTDAKVILDSDWFYVVIPPRRSAEIIIGQTGLDTTDTETQLRIQIAGCESEAVRQRCSYSISNASYETKVFYFKVYPETTGLFGRSNTTVIEYTVSLNKIYNYQL